MIAVFLDPITARVVFSWEDNCRVLPRPGDRIVVQHGEAYQVTNAPQTWYGSEVVHIYVREEL